VSQSSGKSCLVYNRLNTISCRLIANVITILFFSVTAVQAEPSKHSLNEDGALKLLLRTLQHDQVYAKRISLDCVTFDTEETTEAYFQFVLRENHTPKCGGDPDTSPVVDRYRVYRASGKIELYDAVKDSWQRYDPARIR
jgi:hypothetical protein